MKNKREKERERQNTTRARKKKIFVWRLLTRSPRRMQPSVSSLFKNGRCWRYFLLVFILMWQVWSKRQKGMIWWWPCRFALASPLSPFTPMADSIDSIQTKRCITLASLSSSQSLPTNKRALTQFDNGHITRIWWLLLFVCVYFVSSILLELSYSYQRPILVAFTFYNVYMFWRRFSSPTLEC